MAAWSGKSMTLRSAVVIVALLVGVMAAQTYLTHRAATDENFSALRQSVEALDFQLTASLGTIGELLADCSERIDPDRWPDPDVLPWLTGRLSAMPAVVTVLVVGLDGHAIGPGVGARRSFPSPLNVGDREYLRYHLSSPEDHGLHVGEPFVSRLDQQFVLPVSRGIFDKSGRLRGIVRIAIDPARLIGDFASLMSAGTVSNAIFREDVFIAGTAPRDAGFASLPEVRALLRASDGQAGIVRLERGGDLRLVAYRSLPKYELTVIAGIREEEAYAIWRREQLPMMALLAVLAAAIVFFAYLSDRRERRHEEDMAEHQSDLERLVAERTAELRTENQIRAKTDEALRDSRRRLVGITDSLLHSIIVFNGSGEIVFANLAARRILQAEEVEGLPLDDFLQLEEDGVPLLFAQSPLARIVEKGVLFNDDDAVLRLMRSGGDLSVAYVCAPLADDVRRRNFVLSFRDIADIKRAQWELLQASRLASVGQLASGIAHEINTPIQYIGNNLSYIADAVRQLLAVVADPGAERPERKLAVIAEELPGAISESLDGVAQIARIVLSMKEFSHPGSAAKTLVDINHALDTTLNVTSNVWKHAASIERDYDPGLPQVPCLAGEMNQVFLNLIVNAVHAIESSGKPLPGTIVVATRKTGAYAEIRIEDSGTGIAPALRDKIFDPFFTTKEVGKGTGQGLAICQDVVITKHRGTIEVGGAEGAGAVFIIRLPLEDAA